MNFDNIDEEMNFLKDIGLSDIVDTVFNYTVDLSQLKDIEFIYPIEISVDAFPDRFELEKLILEFRFYNSLRYASVNVDDGYEMVSFDTSAIYKICNCIESKLMSYTKIYPSEIIEIINSHSLGGHSYFRDIMLKCMESNPILINKIYDKIFIDDKYLMFYDYLPDELFSLLLQGDFAYLNKISPKYYSIFKQKNKLIRNFLISNISSDKIDVPLMVLTKEDWKYIKLKHFS